MFILGLVAEDKPSEFSRPIEFSLHKFSGNLVEIKCIYYGHIFSPFLSFLDQFPMIIDNCVLIVG